MILHSWHARIDTVVHQFPFLPWSAVVRSGQVRSACTPRWQPCVRARWSQSSIGNLLHTSTRCLRKNGCDAVWTGRHPTTGDVADLLLLRVRRYVFFFRWKQFGAWKEASSETWHRFESRVRGLHCGQVVFFLYKVACALTQGCHLGVQADLT